MTEFQEYIDYIDNFHKKAASIVEAKSRDYAGEDEPMRNFWDAANLAGVSIEQGLLVRMADKLARTRNLTEKGSLGGEVGEKLEDTLMDLSNYAAILSFYITHNYNSDSVNQLKLLLEETPQTEQPVITHTDPKKNLLDLFNWK